MIHEPVLYAGVVCMGLLTLACVVRVIRAPSTSSRILALDTLVLVLIGLLVLWSAAEGLPYLFDAALALALLAFVGTVVAARFHARGRVF